MGIIIGSNFDLGSQIPLDSRDVKATTTLRDAISSSVRYRGLEVFCQDTNKAYKLVAGITNSDWVEQYNTTTPVDSTLLDWSTDRYQPYASGGNNGSLYTGTTDPTGYTRLNYEGWICAVDFVAISQMLVRATTGSTTYSTINYTSHSLTISGTSRMSLQPNIADTGTNVSYMFDTVNALTSGRKLLSVKNQGVEKFYIDYNGDAYANGTKLGSGGGVTLSGYTDNTICTVTGSNAIQGEANLTFNGTYLQINQPAGYTYMVICDNINPFTGDGVSKYAVGYAPDDSGCFGIYNARLSNEGWVIRITPDQYMGTAPDPIIDIFSHVVLSETLTATNFVLSSGANRTISVANRISGAGYNLSITAGSSITSGNNAGGHLYLLGGNALNTAQSGHVYIYGGTVSTAGNIYLAYNGTTAYGYVGIRTAPSSSYALKIAGDVYTNTMMYASDFAQNSDVRLKRDIEIYKPKYIDIDYKQFRFKFSDKLRVGVIAQELEVDNPEFIYTLDTGYKAVSVNDLLFAEIAYLKDKVKELEGRIK